MDKIENQSRRRFIERSAAIGTAAVIGLGHLLESCTTSMRSDIKEKTFLDRAPDGQPLKAGVIGCGGRGTGAALNFLDAGSGLSIHAIADVFQDRVDNFRRKLVEERNMEIEDENVFVGFDAYKRLLETGVDLVILATPPYFRPEHFQASVEARKHVFMEKPVAVDPVGARMILAASRQAEAAGLVVITGTQRHFSRDYVDIRSRVLAGKIGIPVAANVYWNQSKLWHRDPQPGWTEMEYMIRDWVNWTWLSGDHIVEQHIHNIDVINWFTGKTPASANGVGSRQRRLTGDCYDNFFIDFIYGDGVHMNSMCRQINDCSNYVGEYLRGTEGYTNCQDKIWDQDGSLKYEFEYPRNADGEGDPGAMISPYDQEHIDLVAAIRNGETIVQAEDTARSTLTAIMGREAAYTGRMITWEEIMNSDLRLGPPVIAMGPVDLEAVVPKPGTSPLE